MARKLWSSDYFCGLNLLIFELISILFLALVVVGGLMGVLLVGWCVLVYLFVYVVFAAEL